MRITVLGKSPSWQDADGACTGYLVEGGGKTVLLDCGPGVFAKLRGRVDHATVDAVVITHLHADHVLDLIPFASALRYGPRRLPRPLLLAPPGAREAFAGMSSATSMSADHIELAFELTIYDPAQTRTLGDDLTVRFQPVPHFAPANAVDFAAGGARFTFSADCGPNDELVAFASGTDLLFVEATIPEPEADGVRGHLTPFEAGAHGARAGARHVVLTHYTDEVDAAHWQAEGDRGFGAPVDLARAGTTYTLERGRRASTR